MPAWFVLSQVAASTTSAPAPTGSDTPLTTAPGSATPGTTLPKADTGGPLSNLSSLLFPILIIVMLYLFLVRPKGKEAKQQEAMLKALKKGDRVLTIGGLIGSVIEVRGDEVVLKVDESNNVKERYIRSAIKSILVDGDKAEESKK